MHVYKKLPKRQKLCKTQHQLWLRPVQAIALEGELLQETEQQRQVAVFACLALPVEVEGHREQWLLLVYYINVQQADK